MINMITIDSDNILNLNGRRTFPVGIYDICNAYWEQQGTCEPCKPSNNNTFLFGIEEDSISEMMIDKSLFEQAKIYFAILGKYVLDDGIPTNLISSPYFFGYYQIDEPSSSDLTEVSNIYNYIKANDTNHPVILNFGVNTNTTFSAYADIISYDAYPFVSYIPISNALYEYEFMSTYLFGQGTINKPIWAVLQGNGVEYTVFAETYSVPTPNQIRCNTYVAITMDVKGIYYWGYEPFEDPNNTIGLYRNPQLHSYYLKLASEIRSFNDWLISPTLDYSWQYHKGNLVNFDKILNANVEGIDFINFNYILKNYNGSYYLIVVNKDSRPISNVTLTISGLTGTLIANTIGIETTGSGRSGRIIPVNDGKFTDSFDGSVVHIYRINHCSINITDPIAGSIYRIGSNKTIKWEYVNAGKYVKIELLRNGRLVNTISSHTANDGSFSIQVPLVRSGNYQIKITSTSNRLCYGISDNIKIQ